MTALTYIYFVQPEGGGPIKIGRADDPEKRLRALQTGSPIPLRLCRTVQAPPTWEIRLHYTFAAWRSHGEWFKAHPALARLADAIPDRDIPDDPIDLVNVTVTADFFTLSMRREPGVFDQRARDRELEVMGE